MLQLLHSQVYDNHTQEQTDIIIMHSKEKVLRMRKEGRLERGESGSRTQGEWEGVPDGWAVGRERVGAKGGEFGVRGM